MDSLRLVWPMMSPGAVALIHDYGQPALPGVKAAVEKFTSGLSGFRFGTLTELDGSPSMQCTLTKL